MSSNSIKNVKEILDQYNIKPSKGLGQNFLIDRIILDKIVKAAEIKPADIILEIGPGLGVLTQELAKKAKTVIAIEKDIKMCETLKENIKDLKNVEIIQNDILKLPISNYLRYKLVANLPYYITSPVIRKFLEAENKPELMVLMVQKEVAQRICAKPPKMSLLAVSVQFYAKPEIIEYVSKQCFWPKPKVDSAIIKIKPTDKIQIDADLFFKIAKAGFSQPRKQIAGNFRNVLKLSKEETELWLSQSKIGLTQRAESLDIESWIKLVRSFKTFK